jgi:hypothetical protein
MLATRAGGRVPMRVSERRFPASSALQMFTVRRQTLATGESARAAGPRASDHLVALEQRRPNHALATARSGAAQREKHKSCDRRRRPRPRPRRPRDRCGRRRSLRSSVGCGVVENRTFAGARVRADVRDHAEGGVPGTVAKEDSCPVGQELRKPRWGREGLSAGQMPSHAETGSARPTPGSERSVVIPD